VIDPLATVETDALMEKQSVVSNGVRVDSSFNYVTRNAAAKSITRPNRWLRAGIGSPRVPRTASMANIGVAICHPPDVAGTYLSSLIGPVASCIP